MKLRLLRSALLWLGCTSWLISPGLASEPLIARPFGLDVPVLDLELAEGGVLRGEVWGSQGHAQIATDVVLWRDDEMIARDRTDTDGKFRFRGLRGGRYRITAADSVLPCRAWRQGAAPPGARESILLVANMYSARGQQPINEVFCFNPFLMGTVIAAAIAIPIAVHDSGDGQLADGS